MITLGMNGQSIDRILFDNVIELRLSKSASIAITGSFEYTDPTGKLSVLSIEQGATSCATVLESLGKVIASGVVTEEGGLDVRFHDRSSFYIAPDNDFEAWEVNGDPCASKIISMPGGKLAIWD